MWRNWSGRQQSRNAQLAFVRSEEDAVALIADAAGTNVTLRAAGSGHSHSALVPNNDGIVIDCSGLSGVISIDTTTQRAWVWAGTPIYVLGNALSAAGLALHNQGDIDRQTLAGAVSTGTHGTGRQLRNLSSAVTGVRLATASAGLLDISAESHPEAMQCARLSLGALGLLTRIELQLRPRYVLREKTWQARAEAVTEGLQDLLDAHRHAEFFWYPGNDQAQVKVIDEVDAAPAYPLAAEGSRQAWSHEVLPNHRPHLHTEMEYSVPAEHGIECFLAIRSLLRERFSDVRWPVEFRTLAADDVWLSSAYARETVTISVHQSIDEDERPYYEACEGIFREFGGRPHWGKLHYLSGQQLADIHPCWPQWWQCRDSLDPEGLWLNEYLRGLRP